MLNSWESQLQILGVITDSYLKSSAHCAVASKKRINTKL